jgi:hypothetical protein
VGQDQIFERKQNSFTTEKFHEMQGIKLHLQNFAREQWIALSPFI